MSRQVRIELEGELLEEFETVRKELGLTVSSEVVRALIHERAKALRQREEAENIAQEAIQKGREYAARPGEEKGVVKGS